MKNNRLKTMITALASLLALNTQISASTFVSGDVSGTWTKTGSPYIATDNIRVPPGGSLIIQPGVTVIIGQGLKLTDQSAA
jgi:hypothetical protein